MQSKAQGLRLAAWQNCNRAVNNQSKDNDMESVQLKSWRIATLKLSQQGKCWCCDNEIDDEMVNELSRPRWIQTVPMSRSLKSEVAVCGICRAILGKGHYGEGLRAKVRHEIARRFKDVVNDPGQASVSVAAIADLTTKVNELPTYEELEAQAAALDAQPKLAKPSAESKIDELLKKWETRTL